MDTNKVKMACFVSGFTVVLYLALSNLNIFLSGFKTLIGVMSPFIVGIVIAFVLDGVVETFTKRVYTPLFKRSQSLLKAAKLCSILTTYVLLFAGIGLLIGFVVPQLGTSIATLSESIPGYVTALSGWAYEIMDILKLDQNIWAQVNIWLKQLAQTVLNFVPSLIGMIPQVYDVVMTIGGGVFNFGIGIFISIYILADKSRLMSQMKRIYRAFLPRRISRHIGNAANIAYHTFRSYVAGQLLDAMIVGTLATIGLSVFGFPYAMLIGVMMGVTNVIPFFGPFIGAIPSFFIIFMVSPVQSLWYILFVVVLQQLDGNVIVPRIVGSSIGLPPLWVLFAVMVGGGIFGIVGMLVGMPTFSVFYKLLGQATRRRERACAMRRRIRSGDKIQPDG